MLRNSTKPQLKETSRAKSIYFMTWRWHFYAGLFVIPFMLMLSVTGLVMLFDDEIELARYETTLKSGAARAQSTSVRPVRVG